jgi:hypothetical protein
MCRGEVHKRAIQSFQRGGRTLDCGRGGIVFALARRATQVNPIVALRAEFL